DAEAGADEPTLEQRAAGEGPGTPRAPPFLSAAARWIAARIRWYVPQRQMLPVIAASMAASGGGAVFSSSGSAGMSFPGWQQTHWGTSSSIHARCTGWLPCGDSPSIVVTFLPAAADTGVSQARTGAPSRCTVQAPHRAMPQPYLVPVRCRSS